jgi:dihydrofolate reductase
MSRVFLTMAMSLDGFITGPDDDADNPAGVNGMRLMDWLGGGDPDASDSSDDGTDDATDDGSDDGGGGGRKWRPGDPASQVVFDEMLATGAVITGKRTGDFAGYWGGDHHDGVEVFVPTHEAPADNPYERVHFVTDGIAECVRRAQESAGDRDVMMHGAYTAQEALKAGVLDGIELQLRPFLLGQGRRLFDGLPPEHVDLELVRTLEAADTLHLRYDVRRAS